MEIKIIQQENAGDILLPNDPFPLCGKLHPSYINGRWNYTMEHFPDSKITEMCFPNENYNFHQMHQNSIFIGAYDNGICVGLGILQHYWFRYIYLYDLKVSKSHRNKGIATAIMEKAKQIAAEQRYKGIYTVAQDNNLPACQFYLKAGFHIGGLDTYVYQGTTQEGKADILFYLDI